MREGWSVNKLAQCIDNISNTLEIKTIDYKTVGYYPIVSQSEDLIVGYTDDEKYLIHLENPVIVFGDHTRIVKFIDFDFCVGADGVKILSTKNFLSPKYLYHFLQYKKVPSLGYSRHYKLLKDIDVIFPTSLSTQLNVSSELDMITELISKYDEQLKELNKLSQSIFYEMFGDPVENEKGWEVSTIEMACKLKSGNSEINYSKEGTLPYIKVSDMNLPLNERYIRKSTSYVEYESNKKNIIPKGSTIFPKRGGAIFTNKKRITIEEICCDLNIMAVIPEKKIHPEYLYMYFVLIDFSKLPNGSSIPQINNKDIGPLKISLPPLSLQQSFARKIEAIEAMKAKVKEAKKEAETLLAARMQYWFE